MKDLSHSIKFLADENVDARLVKFLSGKNIDIKYSSKGLRNSKLFSIACEENRVLLTHDKDFMNILLTSDQTFPGIVIIRIHPPRLEKLETSIINLIEYFSEEDIKDKVVLLAEESIKIME